ncbi:cysteine desulfurase family protein [Paenibacillus apis]|uniref:Aminotransferase V n=1 Tax=Paenibacillus apis TaxID=1792174 RepID=A0A919XYG4_9BACL|nr:cysteine desulfurase family protein [Paenibacillus apis]GIO41646.1 aminotransferase V [Paenibacillus apis]
MNKLYFDYCASAPLHPQVIHKLIDSSVNLYANASSTHEMGFEVNRIIEASRERIANVLHVKPSEVIFTSGATESNNMAILGVVRAYMKRTSQIPHLILSEIEHSSVYNCCKQLRDEGVEVTFLGVDRSGVVDPSALEKAIQDNTVLVSIMHVNNETGTIQPVQEIGKLLKTKPAIQFHVDGVQGFGKANLDLEDIDLYTLSGHKMGGPKGIGILMAKEGVELMPLMYGGNNEFGHRPGTTNVPGVVCLTEAVELSIAEQVEKTAYLTSLHHFIYSKLQSIPELIINTPEPPLSAPHIINFSYQNKGITSAIMISILAKKNIVVSSQSACSSKAKESRVLMAMTHNEEIASSSIRLSLHESVSFEDAKYLVNSITEMIDQIKSTSKFQLLLHQK